MPKPTKTTTNKANKQEYEQRVTSLVNMRLQQGVLFTRNKAVTYMQQMYGVGERQAVKYWEKASERIIECLDPQQVKESVATILMQLDLEIIKVQSDINRLNNLPKGTPYIMEGDKAYPNPEYISELARIKTIDKLRLTIATLMDKKMTILGVKSNVSNVSLEINGKGGNELMPNNNNDLAAQFEIMNNELLEQERQKQLQSNREAGLTIPYVEVKP
jgi:hypothetical protein